MSVNELFSHPMTASMPRHAHVEIADLLGMALCRLRQRNASLLTNAHPLPFSPVGLGISGPQSVYDNSSSLDGV
jgi:hypothetical protein